MLWDRVRVCVLVWKGAIAVTTDRAIADFGKAIEINPRYANAFSNRSLAYRAKGDNEHAIADYNMAIEIDPKLATAQ